MRARLLAGLLALAAGAHAETVRWASTRTVVNDTAVINTSSAPMVTACKVPLSNMIDGENAFIDGFVTVTNDTDAVVGFTTEIYMCDPACRNLRTAPNFASFDGGNVTRELHHGAYRPFAKLTWDRPVRSAYAILTVRAYSTSGVGQTISIDNCGLLVRRHRP